MNGKDLRLSIQCALYEEQKKAYNNRELFDRNKIAIMATAKAVSMITAMLDPCVNYYSDCHTELFGCKLKMIDGEDAEVYLARKIPILPAKLSEEGAEEWPNVDIQ